MISLSIHLMAEFSLIDPLQIEMHREILRKEILFEYINMVAQRSKRSCYLFERDYHFNTAFKRYNDHIKRKRTRDRHQFFVKAN